MCAGLNPRRGVDYASASEPNFKDPTHVYPYRSKHPKIDVNICNNKGYTTLDMAHLDKFSDSAKRITEAGGVTKKSTRKRRR